MDDTPPKYSETSPEVIALSLGKWRLSVRGKVSVYRLKNGWIAKRVVPDNGWAREAVWTIYPSQEAADRQGGGHHLGGAPGRLTRAIATALNYPRIPILPSHLSLDKHKTT